MNIELLAPAGNMEKLKYALQYGADAVYIGGEAYGLRASADNFTIDEMKDAVQYTHNLGKKIYLTMNIIAHNEDFQSLEQYIKDVALTGIDAIIVSDPGFLEVIKENAPNIELHLSTQANCTNWRSAEFWYKQGVKRVVMARELSLEEISEIREKTYGKIDIEAFIHGAMCISYSGRCLMSSYMTGRDSNRGACAHPCRWKYYLMEEKRPGEYLPVYENDRGTFIFNSKDLCMIENIPDLVKAGITSFKIEGRMKSSYYVATVVKAYREAIDSFQNNPDEYKFNTKWMDELSKASHREYTKGFYFGKTKGEDQIYHTSSYIRDYDFIGTVLEYKESSQIAIIEQRNRMYEGETIEILPPSGDFYEYKINGMMNEDDLKIDVAPHPQMIVKMKMETPVLPLTILRREARK
jgi:putative protease